MIKKLSAISLAFTMLFGSLAACGEFESLEASSKRYIDGDDFSANALGDSFHIHVGNNIWLTTNTIHRDSTGLFAYEYTLSREISGCNMEYEKKWKCPYCYNFWPIGKPCGNKECPSKFK